MTVQPASDLRLADGRLLSYVESGDPDGTPVVYAHGWPGNHLEWGLLDPSGGLAADRRIRVIAFDREGYLSSDPSRGASLMDLAADLGQLLDGLEVERATVIAYSGGCPMALAAGARLPDRLDRVVLVACAGPFENRRLREDLLPAAAAQYRLARYAPVLFRAMYRQLAAHPERMVAGMRNSLPPPDRAVLDDEQVVSTFQAMLRGLGTGGLEGAVADGRRNWGDWPFALSEVDVPVHLWQGGMDVNAPPAIARWLATQLPDATLHFEPADGHLSLLRNHAAAILDCALAGD